MDLSDESATDSVIFRKSFSYFSWKFQLFFRKSFSYFFAKFSDIFSQNFQIFFAKFSVIICKILSYFLYKNNMILYWILRFSGWLLSLPLSSSPLPPLHHHFSHEGVPDSILTWYRCHAWWEGIFGLLMIREREQHRPTFATDNAVDETCVWGAY